MRSKALHCLRELSTSCGRVLSWTVTLTLTVGTCQGAVGMQHSLAAGVGQEPGAADGVADVSGGDGERRGGGDGLGGVAGGRGNCWPRTCETDCMKLLALPQPFQAPRVAWRVAPWAAYVH